MIRKALFSLTLAAGLAIAGSANAARIVYDFTGVDDNTTPNTTASFSSNDFGSGVIASNITTTGGVLVGQSEGGQNSVGLGVVMDYASLGLGTPVGNIVFTVTIPSDTTVDLTSLAFDFDYLSTNNGGADVYQGWTLGISTGSGTPNSGSTGPIPVGNIALGGAYLDEVDITLSGLTGLTDTTVTFTIGLDNGVNSSFGNGSANNRRTVVDNVTLTGEVVPVPEPASLATGLLGLTMIAARRRRS
jgi:MYXO-CTERM domain-containing protein